MYNIINKLISKRGWFTLFALLITINLSAQQDLIKGVVIDETNTPLIGATVMVKEPQTELLLIWMVNSVSKLKKVIL